MLSLGTLPVLAQEAPKPDPTQLYSLLDGRTIVKIDPLSVAVGKLNLQVERLFARGVSGQLGLYFTPEGATGTQSGAFHFQSYALSNSAILSPEQPRYIAISPQLRWYLNGGLGHGFYIQAHYRLQRSEFTHQHLHSLYEQVGNERQYISVDYDGQATTHSYGLSIGAQWLFGRRKNIVLDWHILGADVATHVGASLGPIPLQLAMQRSKKPFERVSIEGPITLCLDSMRRSPR